MHRSTYVVTATNTANSRLYIFLFKVRVAVDSAISTLLSSSSAAVHTGQGQMNVLAVVAMGSHIDLYVNHQKINSTTNGAEPSGNVNLERQEHSQQM